MDKYEAMLKEMNFKVVEKILLYVNEKVHVKLVN